MASVEFDYEEGEDEVEVEEDELELTGPIILDLGAVRDEPVAEGWHSVEIERADPGLSNQKKIPKIFILSRLIDEADEDYNRTQIWNAMLEGDGLIFTKRCMKALGLPDQLAYDSVEDFCADLVGRQVQVQTRHRIYKGEKQSSASNWRPLQAIAYA